MFWVGAFDIIKLRIVRLTENFKVLLKNFS